MSNTNKLREAAIKILGMFEPVEPCQHTESQIELIQGHLREVVEEAEKNCLVASMKIYKKGTEDAYEEARAEAIDECAKIATETDLNVHPDCAHSIARTLRALKP